MPHFGSGHGVGVENETLKSTNASVATPHNEDTVAVKHLDDKPVFSCVLDIVALKYRLLAS